MSLRWPALLLFVACATPQPKGPPPTAPAARSAVAAVLQHAEELALADGQYTQLLQIDQQRELKLADFKQAREDEKNKINGPPPPNNPFAGPSASQKRRRTAEEQAALDARFDEVDAEAFYSAEAFLNPAQIEKARVIASAWRDELLTWRAAMKTWEGR